MKYKSYKNEFWNEKEATELFQILPFCNFLIKKPKIKHLSNIQLLHELPFYDELSVVEISKAFKRYARSYKIEIIDSKDPLAQIEASKSSIVYFNSATKTVINSDKYGLDKSFHRILNRIDNWLNKGCGWLIESIEAQYVNISIYSPLIGSTYIELPDKLKYPMKGLINIKNNGNKCFIGVISGI